jgi:hypothetical protein
MKFHSKYYKKLDEIPTDVEIWDYCTDLEWHTVNIKH